MTQESVHPKAGTASEAVASAPPLAGQATSGAPDLLPTREVAVAQLTPIARRTLMSSMLVSYLVLFATYAGVIVILLPEQVSNLDPAHKVGNLAIVTATSSLVTLFVQPIVGALSDRTRARLGRRSPFIVFGGIGGGLATIALQFGHTIFWITLIWVLAQVTLNAFQGPISAVIADRINAQGRATASAFTGVGTAVGGTLGVIIGGQLLAHLGVAFWAFGVAMIVVAVLFVLFNRDTSSVGMKVPVWSWKAFGKSFWVSPRKHPDYAWAFGGRFFMILGYQGIQAYQLYILTDYIHLSPAAAGATAGILSLCSMVTLVIGTLVFGRLSDKLNRRKVFVFFATIVMAIGIAIPIFAPSVAAMIVYSVVVGIGYGAYIAVDLALMIDVLPSQGDLGKDLGVLNIASNIPQALTPVIAAGLLGLFAGNYASIFAYAIVMVVVSSVLVFPIKSVR